MWNLLANKENLGEKSLLPVTIITSYYHTEKDQIYFIAVDEVGNFYNEYMGNFRSQNKKGFAHGEL
ncbi:hypothetical protein ACFLXL_01860 [Chloroflexota bacterium]